MIDPGHRSRLVLLALRSLGAFGSLAMGVSLFRSQKRRQAASNRPREPQESDRYPALRHLSSAFFHQDYDLDLGTEDVEEGIRIYTKVCSASEKEALIDDIHRFLAAHPREDPALGNDFSRVFSPDVDFCHWNGRSTREGLLKIVELLSTSTEQDAPPKE